MAKCPACNRYMKDGTWDKHHIWFPKTRHKGTRKGRLVIPIHYQCHQRFHYHFLHECLSGLSRTCNSDPDRCQYIKFCCYARG